MYWYCVLERIWIILLMYYRNFNTNSKIYKWLNKNILRVYSNKEAVLIYDYILYIKYNNKFYFISYIFYLIKKYMNLCKYSTSNNHIIIYFTKILQQKCSLF